MEFTTTQLLYFILALPIIFSVTAAANVLSLPILHWADRLTATLVAGAAGLLLITFNPDMPVHDGYFYIDALSVWMLLIISTLYLAFAWTSKAYLERDTNIRYGYLRRFTHLEGRFYALSHIFVWTMMLVVLVDSLGLMWVTIEATTLVSALLVAFKFTRTSLEAAWKYVMVCTVGICLALLGTILVYYAQLGALGGDMPLDWAYLAEHGSELNPRLAKMAFCFLFVGYGTKIGLAPMHAWLPDTYSEAPSLTSGMLSGALCTCVIYVLLRATIILMPAVGVDFIGTMSMLSVTVTPRRLCAFSAAQSAGCSASGRSP